MSGEGDQAKGLSGGAISDLFFPLFPMHYNLVKSSVFTRVMEGIFDEFFPWTESDSTGGIKRN